MTYPPGQPQPYQHPYYQPSAPPYPPARSTNGFAIASLILGIIGGILLSVIFGIVALNQTKGGKQAGRGMAIAGLVLSGVWTLLIVVAVVLVIIFDDGSVRSTDIEVGDCIETTPADMSTVKRLPKVSCDQPHEGEVYALLQASGDSFPGHSALRAVFEEKCLTALDSYSSRAANDPGYRVFVLYPTQDTWGRGDRRVACLATTADKRTDSVTE